MMNTVNHLNKTGIELLRHWALKKGIALCVRYLLLHEDIRNFCLLCVFGRVKWF